jgi:hypothetical protein
VGVIKRQGLVMRVVFAAGSEGLRAGGFKAVGSHDDRGTTGELQGHPIVPLSSPSCFRCSSNTITTGLFSRRTPPPRPVRTSAFFSTVLSHKANLLSERYSYPACRCRQASLIQILKFYERPCIVPHEVIRPNVVFPGSLRRNPVCGASCTKNGCAESP